MQNEPTLDDLVAKLATAKAAESLANQHRIKLEEAVAAMVPGPEIGQKTVKLADGTSVSVKRGFNYKADCEKIVKVCIEEFGTTPPIDQKTTLSLNTKGYEWNRAYDPSVFAAISEHVTVTPKKVAVEIKAPKV